MTHAILTGADAGFFSFLFDTVASVRHACTRPDIRICVFDLGLTDEQRATLSPLIDAIETPAWDIDFGFSTPAEDWRKYVTAGPFARQYFPGHDSYVWIDADAWVQTGEAVDLLIAGAMKGRLAICQFADRAYPTAVSGARVKLWGGLPGLAGRRRAARTWMHQKFSKYYGRRLANETFFTPSLNAGIWALPAEAPHWQAWIDSLNAADFRTPRNLSDQVALNHAVLTQGLPLELLPAWCNWICVAAAPAYDRERGLFVEPSLPHHPIGILHLVDRSKRETYEIATLDGDRITRTLRPTPAEIGLDAAPQ